MLCYWNDSSNVSTESLNSDNYIKGYVVIKPLLIVLMTSFNLVIMARCAWTSRFMFNTDFVTEYIKWMRSLGGFLMCQFTAIICLYYERSITKVSNCVFYKLDVWIGTLFRKWEDETFAGCFINYCILINFCDTEPL